MADETISDEDFYKYFRTYLSAKYHPLVEKYGEVLSQAMACKGEARKWRKEFDKLKTNFDRVFFILKALECFNKDEKGIRVLGLPPTKETNTFLTNGKSDAIAKKCLSMSDKFYRERKLMKALVAVNRAYFSAVSKAVKFDILLKRIRLIKKFNVDEVLEEEMGFILKNKPTDEETQTADSLREDIERIIDFQVGFCSDKCADEARNPNSSLNGGPGRHVYDCGGLLPCLRLDDLFTDEIVNFQGLTHLAFICIANTPTHILLDNICSSSSNTRNSSVHKSSDYSSIMRGRSCIGKPPKDLIWKSTVVSVFLTYCLSIAGYPMKWFTEAKEHFYSLPSSTTHPDCLPASWIAAQLVSHFSTNNFNAKECMEYYEETKELSSNTNWIANCIYPTICLISHDCNPTACMVNTVNGCAFIYALRSIKKGETISLTYGTFYFTDSSAESRRKFLQFVYSFNCSCEACRNDWRVNKRSDFEILKCPLCESSFKSTKEKCLSCKKASGYWMYQKILHEMVPFLTSTLKYESRVRRNCASEVISAMEEAQRLISSPSPTVAVVLSQGMQIIERMYGMRNTLIYLKTRKTALLQINKLFTVQILRSQAPRPTQKLTGTPNLCY
nr:SET and MYND domain containing protein 4 [Hymenolepis microstoma]